MTKTLEPSNNEADPSQRQLDLSYQNFPNWQQSTSVDFCSSPRQICVRKIRWDPLYNYFLQFNLLCFQAAREHKMKLPVELRRNYLFAPNSKWRKSVFTRGWSQSKESFASGLELLTFLTGGAWLMLPKKSQKCPKNAWKLGKNRETVVRRGEFCVCFWLMLLSKHSSCHRPKLFEWWKSFCSFSKEEGREWKPLIIETWISSRRRNKRCVQSFGFLFEQQKHGFSSGKPSSSS